eukprot:TRINITY_DN65411_c0_g1_i1.p1 TRINITY_DN65411_c0_g1~~TRINITY_DN65411_c0_g1_i1.p1  ORF type:complete len:439 (+),score=217.17 TRINITY_DN65411_c0_g1_i1:59-1375(+)
MTDVKKEEGETDLLDFNDEEPQPVATEQRADAGYSTAQIRGFREFLLKPELNRAITDNGFEHPSEVQHQAIPAAMLGQDILAQAKSGMGKTAVFVLSVLHQLEEREDKVVQAICLVHTRELAYQIQREFVRFSKYLPYAKVAVFYGGIQISQNKALLQKKGDDFPSIVVSTPGRLVALVKGNILNTEHVKYFVMDEADQLLEKLDMRRDVQDVFMKCPTNKQVLMFSATLSKDIRDLAKKFMKDPLEIYVDSQSKLTLHGLQQYYIEVEENKKNRKLNDLLDALEFNQVMIFVRSPQRATALNAMLKECGFPSTCIHGRMDQKERIETYQAFKEFKSRICVATNLFGRGIDIDRVNIVIQYDMAESADTYLHRVGRAGRFGTKGLAICFLTNDAREKDPKSKEPALSDKEVMTAVQERFEVDVQPLPDQISVESYMQN